MTRIVLHKTFHSEVIYQILHAEMEAAGFRRTIFGRTGKEYHLPPAEYFCETYYTRLQVLKVAKRVARNTGKSFSIIVTESDGSTWIGLEPVKKKIAVRR